MKVTRIMLRHFRNYPQQSLTMQQNINIFVGRNAQGKTNLLEALYVAALGRSHRTNNDAEMISWQEQETSVEVEYERHGVSHTANVRISRTALKEVVLNGHPVKARELIGNLNAVLFSPEDLTFVKGAPAQRRRFLDMEISQTSRAYYQELTDYNRILQQRNNPLKKIRERRAQADQLDTWDGQLAAMAASLVRRRKNALRKMVMLANLMHRKLTDSSETLTTEYYQPYFEKGRDEEHHTLEEEWYRHKILHSRSDDVLRGFTSVGPHRDDLHIAVNNVSLRIYGSQGQQRTGALAFKLAELEYIKSETGEYPILLLDDVMSELDKERREQLTGFVKDRIQTFITATDRELFSLPKFATVYQIEKGEIERLS